MKQERILIFDTTISGHHLEYIHHIYDAALNVRDKAFCFVIPKQFHDVKDKFTWPSAPHITFDYLSEKELKVCECTNLLVASYHKSKLLRNRIKANSANKVFLIMLMQFMPFLLLFTPYKVRVSGIIYRIYLYNWKHIGYMRKLQEVVKYTLISKFKRVHTAFVLNDTSAAACFNRLYKTEKFKYLPDPVVPITDQTVDFRDKYDINPDAKVFLHFGGLTARKGTLIISDSLYLLTEEEKRTYVFVFAGKIYDDINSIFYKKVTELKQQNVHILVFDEFCSYSFLCSCCMACNVILVPYSDTNLSSGVIGYAAQFCKPVIGPKKGLLGKLIKKYNLGVCLTTIDENLLYSMYATKMSNIKENAYMESHKKECFSLQILQNE